MKPAIAALLLLSLPIAASAEPVRGPVIEEYGPVYYVPDQPVALAREERLRVVFDVAAAPDEATEPNYRFEAPARFLNLNARSGIPRSRMDVAIVLHGRATRSALDDAIFEERYGEVNPDARLLDGLRAAGVELIVCGQSATAFGFSPEELRSGIRMSASAMTSLVRLQARGYALIPWGTQ